MLWVTFFPQDQQHSPQHWLLIAYHSLIPHSTYSIFHMHHRKHWQISSLSIEGKKKSEKTTITSALISYCRTQAVFNDMEASYRAFELLSSPHGANYPWLSTAIYLRSAESSISSLLDQLVEAIDTADKSPSRVRNCYLLCLLYTLSINNEFSMFL